MFQLLTPLYACQLYLSLGYIYKVGLNSGHVTGYTCGRS